MRKLMVMGLVAAGCSSGSSDPAHEPFPDQRPARQIPDAERADADAVARGGNQLAFELYAQLGAVPGNFVFSPFSISTALAMTDAGAAGTTDHQLRAALHATDLTGDRLHAANAAILASLAIGRTSGAYALAAADRLYGQQGFGFLPGFLALTQKDYGAALAPVNFASDLEAARATINAWVADQTDQTIPTLFQPGDLTADTVLALVNAIAFKGTWDLAFAPDATRDAAFHRADGTTVQAPLMHKTDALALRAIPGATIGVLPFGGLDLAMAIVLPDRADGLPVVEAGLAAAGLGDLIDGAQATGAPIAITLPKLALTSGLPLTTALTTLGLGSAFAPTLADFSGIDGQHDLALQHVMHQAVITVNEAGAEATGTTGVGVQPTAVGGSGQQFTVDRPFVFAIYDRVTHSLLFLGRVSDPTTK